MDNYYVDNVIHQDILNQLREYPIELFIEFTSKLSTFFNHLNPP